MQALGCKVLGTALIHVDQLLLGWDHENVRVRDADVQLLDEYEVLLFKDGSFYGIPDVWWDPEGRVLITIDGNHRVALHQRWWKRKHFVAKYVS